MDPCSDTCYVMLIINACSVHWAVISWAWHVEAHFYSQQENVESMHNSMINMWSWHIHVNKKLIWTLAMLSMLWLKWEFGVNTHKVNVYCIVYLSPIARQSLGLHSVTPFNVQCPHFSHYFHTVSTFTLYMVITRLSL